MIQNNIVVLVAYFPRYPRKIAYYPRWGVIHPHIGNRCFKHNFQETMPRKNVFCLLNLDLVKGLVWAQNRAGTYVNWCTG